MKWVRFNNSSLQHCLCGTETQCGILLAGRERGGYQASERLILRSYDFLPLTPCRDCDPEAVAYAAAHEKRKEAEP